VIYVWVRAVPDWEDEEAFWAQLPPRLRPRVELWNSTIKMPFHLFRHRVREIAALNQSRVEDALYAEWDEIPNGARVVPVDDDDWFAPNLAEMLEREWGPERGVCWNPLWIGVPADFGHWIYTTRRSLLPSTWRSLTCDTNNYALVKGPGTRPLFNSHDVATEWFDGHGRRDDVRRIRECLSINNRSLASQTSLRPTTRRGEIDRTRLVERLAAYKRIYRRRWWQREPTWSRPYVAMMAELMDEVGPR
jgi:hypothetical protein